MNQLASVININVITRLVFATRCLTERGDATVYRLSIRLPVQNVQVQ